MGKIDRLIKSYSKFIAVPWQSDAAPAQRVIFCVYNEHDERQIRTKIDEFEIETKQSDHNWALFDLTDTFADWLTNQRYKQSYFKNPELISTILPNYLIFLAKLMPGLNNKNRASFVGLNRNSPPTGITPVTFKCYWPC